jgi:hypothetical protein
MICLPQNDHSLGFASQYYYRNALSFALFSIGFDNPIRVSQF